MTPDERDQRIHFRIAQDAHAMGTSIYWRRRADLYDWARPRPGDYPGQSTAADRRARDERLAQLASACRNEADLIDEERRGAAA